jgi:7-cyano-7-deazaguanine tRNA-ribosyltransferase
VSRGLAFEVVEKDVLGRIGRLTTKTGVIETPLLLPVVNPLVQPLSPQVMERDFDCQALIANAYLLKKNFGEEVTACGIHEFLGFHRVVMTDSGAYQLLVYGDVDVSPVEIARFQEDIGSDIAVILDVPTGWNMPKEKAKDSVEETLRRARVTLDALTRRDILWVGPIQGGNHLDYVAHSAAAIGAMGFPICALGSPTQVMERYLFAVLVDMIMAAKQNAPLDRPLHLFGAGHPFMLSFAVAMGCDLFDSAAYALYARQDKYLTTHGTSRLRTMEYFPCSCPVCSKHTPKELRAMPPQERERMLAQHNLATCFTEIRRIKQAIREGRLWELLEVRSRSHPALLDALKRLQSYRRVLEAHSPSSKGRGLFFFDATGLTRPAVLRHQIKLSRWQPPQSCRVLVFLPPPPSKPFHRSREVKRILRAVERAVEAVEALQFCVYAAPFGVVPLVLDEVYPLSQFEASVPLDRATEDYVINQVRTYILAGHHGCSRVVLHAEADALGTRLIHACEAACSQRSMPFHASEVTEKTWSKRAVESLVARVVCALQNGKVKDDEKVDV